MANLMVRELMLSDELDKMALTRIVGGQNLADLTRYTTVAVGSAVTNDTWGATIQGPIVFLGTVYESGRVRQEWEETSYKIGYKTIIQKYQSDFTSAGMP